MIYDLPVLVFRELLFLENIINVSFSGIFSYKKKCSVYDILLVRILYGLFWSRLQYPHFRLEHLFGFRFSHFWFDPYCAFTALGRKQIRKKTYGDVCFAYRRYTVWKFDYFSVTHILTHF